MVEINEAAIIAISTIMGEQSAAAKALKNAAGRRAQGQAVRFYSKGNTLIVEGIPASQDSAAVGTGYGPVDTQKEKS